MRILRRFLPLVAAIMAIFLAASDTFAHEPDTPGAAFGTSEEMTKLLQSQMGTPVTRATMQAFAKSLKEFVENTRNWSSKIREVVAEQANAIFLALLLPILAAEITFAGFRIMMRASISEQFTRLTITSFILITVSAVIGGDRAGDESVLIQGRDSLIGAGRTVGAEIISRAATADTLTIDGINNITSTDESKEPVAYWIYWIGVPSLEGQEESQGKPTSFKFGRADLMSRVWGDPGGLSTAPGDSPPAAATGLDLGAVLSAGSDLVTETASFGIYAILPFILVGLLLSIAGVQTGAILSIAFIYVGMLVGAIVTMDVTLGIVKASLPLIFFKSFERIWAQGLVGLTALALIPFLYYIFAAIGFVFVDNVYNGLFPPRVDDSAETTLGQIINGVFMASVTVLSSDSGGILGGLMALASSMANGLVAVFFLGKLQFASMILATLIGAGAMFGSIAAPIAFRWNSGFASEEVFGRLNQALTGLGSTIGSGIGTMYSQAAGQGGRALGGGLKGLGSMMGRR